MGTLQITAVTENDDGQYDCIVTNGVIETTSEKATLTVTNDQEYINDKGLCNFTILSQKPKFLLHIGHNFEFRGVLSQVGRTEKVW